MATYPGKIEQVANTLLDQNHAAKLTWKEFNRERDMGIESYLR